MVRAIGNSLLIAAAAGLLWSRAVPAAVVIEPTQYWQGPINAPVPAGIRGGRVLHARAAAALAKIPGTGVFDVSDMPRKPPELAPGAPWLPLPHRAIPGAQWIPGTGDAVITAAQEQFFRNRLEQVTAGNLEAPVIIYCHTSCWLSWNAAKRAINFGYRRVNWFPDGIEGWLAAGLPTAMVTAQGPSNSAASGATVAVTNDPPPVSAAARLPALVVLDLELSGDLGGAELTVEHAARLVNESTRLRQDLQRAQLYQVLENGPAQTAIDRLKLQQAYLHDCNGCDLDIGRQLHADEVMVAWVNRVSGLILTLTYEIHDVRTSQILSRKSYDFRGDSDNTWNHAIDYMVRDLLEWRK